MSVRRKYVRKEKKKKNHRACLFCSKICAASADGKLSNDTNKQIIKVIELEQVV